MSVYAKFSFILLLNTDPPDPPTVSTSAIPINLTTNNYNLSLECEIMPDNGFHYEWVKRSKPLPMERIQVHSSRMTIKNLKPEDSGDYRCIVSNSTGAIRSQYKKVVVTGTYVSMLMLVIYCEHMCL